MRAKASLQGAGMLSSNSAQDLAESLSDGSMQMHSIGSPTYAAYSIEYYILISTNMAR